MKLHIHYCPVCDRMSGATFNPLPDVVNTMTGGIICVGCARDICEVYDALWLETKSFIPSLANELRIAQRVFNGEEVDHSRRHNVMAFIKDIHENRERRQITALRQELIENERNRLGSD